ncbi:MAG: zincin-like metallopeptidase domain-containing protein [Paracoccaceae bacterium]|nr:zincin-like metallopeptidase domain-containing protein [Paracoccaceae bacterium]
MADKMNVHQQVTNTILKQLEAGTPPWRRPWIGGGSQGSQPLRFNGEAYRGINTLLLWAEGLDKGFTSERWMTFRQAKELGGNVRKGEKSATSIKYGTFEREDDNGTEAKIPYLRAYRVFNADQIDNLPEEFYIQPEPVRDLGTNTDPELDQFFANTGAKIISTEEPKDFYRPSTDTVHMPPITSFFEARRFYGVLSHEVCHWTGASNRLDRLSKFGNRAVYAFEELVAEIGACLLSVQLGVEPDFEQSAAYLQSWITALKGDNKAIFKAATEAQKAVDFIMEQSAKGKTQKAA